MHANALAVRTRSTRPTRPGRSEEGVRSHGAVAESLLALQRLAGNRATTALVQRDPTYVDSLSDPMPAGRSTRQAGSTNDLTVPPQQRDVLLAAAKGSIEQGLTQLPSCLSLASQLLGVAQSPTPGGMPGPPPQTIGVGSALVGTLQMSGTQLDTGLRVYESAGGRLADIPAVLTIRGHVSSALFFARQLMAGTPGVAHQVFTFAQATMPALAAYRAGEANRLVGPQQGPETAADAARAAGESAVLRTRYLGALGAAPTVSP